MTSTNRMESTRTVDRPVRAITLSPIQQRPAWYASFCEHTAPGIHLNDLSRRSGVSRVTWKSDGQAVGFSTHPGFASARDRHQVRGIVIGPGRRDDQDVMHDALDRQRAA